MRKEKISQYIETVVLCWCTFNINRFFINSKLSDPCEHYNIFYFLKQIKCTKTRKKT